MKRLNAWLLVVCMAVGMLSFAAAPVSAAEAGETVEYLADGSYIVTSISVMEPRASGTKTATDLKTCYGTDGAIDWKIALSATFTYDGVTAKCTKTNCTVTIYDDAWYKISAEDTFAGSMAWATVEMGKKVLGITTEKNTYRLTLSCDPDGNVC